MITPCPWASLTYRPAEFCEESLCAWIRQPANTWTNIGFVLAGLAIWRASLRDDAKHLRGLAVVAIAIGLGSAFFHASETFLGRLFDYGGMYMGAAYMLAVNVRRWLLPSRRVVRFVFWVAVFAPLGLMLVDDRYAMGLYMAEGIFCCLGLEGLLYLRQRGTANPVHYRWLGWYWLVFLVGYAIWWLDLEHVLCSPGNHWISGHGVWHLLDALALYFTYFYYLQFDVLRFERTGRREAS